jgi:hypothetical protein
VGKQLLGMGELPLSIAMPNTAHRIDGDEQLAPYRWSAILIV